MSRKQSEPRAIRPLKNLEFVSQVNSKKTVYYVMRTGEDYVVYSFRNVGYRKGNFHVVRQEDLVRVLNEFAGEKRVTSSMVQRHPKMQRFYNRFDILYSLYVLVAIGQAKIDRRSRNTPTLYFNFASK